jgi:hypothetical protein
MLSVNLPVRTLLVFPFFIKSFNTVGISPTVSLSKKTMEVQNTRR